MVKKGRMETTDEVEEESNIIAGVMLGYDGKQHSQEVMAGDVGWVV
jgi:hypothetical protein